MMMIIAHIAMALNFIMYIQAGPRTFSGSKSAKILVSIFQPLFDMPPVRMEFAWCVDRIVYAPHAASDTATRRYVCIECKGDLDLRRTTVKAHGGRYNVPAYFAHETYIVVGA